MWWDLIRIKRIVIIIAMPTLVIRNVLLSLAMNYVFRPFKGRLRQTKQAMLPLLSMIYSY